MKEGESSFTVRPIGFVRSARRAKFDAPNQPQPEAEEVNLIELLPTPEIALGLSDLAGFDRIWVVSWFDRNLGWRPRVLPPRGPAKRRGVFATRAPHRPNPIGLTSTPLLGIEGTTLEVGPLDLLDGTPVLDIKPYLHTVDAHPESSLGWVAEVEAMERDAPSYRVEVAPKAQDDLDWLQTEWDVDFMPRALQILTRDPQPHRTRRIVPMPDGRLRLACGPWRLFYRLDHDVVRVEEVGQGYSDEALQKADAVDREAQIAFRLRAKRLI